MSMSVLTRDISASAFRSGLLWLLVLGLVVRTGYLVGHAQQPDFGVPTLDQEYYDTAARILLAGEDLHQLHGFRPLLYPLFLAGCYQVAGAWGIDLALLVQHLLGIATGLIVALLGTHLFRHRLGGLAGGALFLLAPVPLCFEGELLVEPAYTFLIVLGLLLHFHAARATGRKSAALWLLGGSLIALAAQARANILVFMAVYPLFALWRGWQTRRPAALLPLLGLLGGLAMAALWGLVNLQQTDHFQLLPGASGVNLYLGNKQTADGMVPAQERRIAYGDRYEDSVEIWAREEYQTAMQAQGRHPETDPAALSRYWTRRALDEIRAEPGAWLGLMAKKCWLTLWNAEIPNNKSFAFLQQESLALLLLPVRWVVLFMLAPAGIWAASRRGNRGALFIVLTFIFLYSAANVLFFICDRYRYPVWPAMAVLAGGGLATCLETVAAHRWRTTLCLAASMALMAALSLPNWGRARLPSFARDFLFRSMACYEKGRYQEALSDADRSVALDPTDATAVHHRGNVLFALNRREEAQSAYGQALRLSPQEAGIWNNLGTTLEALGQTNGALQAFRRATECQPPSKTAFLGLALIQTRAGRLEEAADTLERLDKLEPRPNAAVLALRSVLARRRGDAPQADELERQAHALDPEAASWAIGRAGVAP